MSAVLLTICQLTYLPLRALEQYRDKGRDFAEWMERAYNAPLIAEYKGGRNNVLDFFIGQVMKQTRGQANPSMTSKIIKEEIDKR